MIRSVLLLYSLCTLWCVPLTGGGLPPNMPQFMPSGPYPGMPGMGMNGVPGMHGGRPPNMPPNMHPGMPPNMPPHMMPGRGGGGGQMY